MVWQVFTVILFLLKVSSGQLQYSIAEELKKGTVVGNLANDLGMNVKELAAKFQVVAEDKIQYFRLNIENGDLLILKRIDREAMCGAKLRCFLNLEAVIENPLHFYTITIEIQDVNDNLPTFSKNIFSIEISEFTSPGARFALGNAQDPDLTTNSVQSYSLTANEYFSLGEKITKDGIKYPEIHLEKSLDREIQNSYELILTAYDGGQPPKSGTATVKIDVHDDNDNYPTFTQDTYYVNLQENAPVDFLVIDLNATDEDEGSNAEITYSFNHILESDLQIFSINPQHGDIRIVGSLDYETADSYEITVEAKDGGGHTTHCKISIQVIDVNDNIPEIAVTSVFPAIQEDSPTGTIIALIKIRDLDSGQNGEVICQLHNTKPFQLISLSSSYYKLVTAANMDRERNSRYNITIHCMDNGSPILSSNKTIELLILDVNDNSPAFEKMEYIIYIAENNQPGALIHKVHALDLDQDDNGKIIYSILNSKIEEIPVPSYISINSVTGVLYAQRSFDYEQLREFQFQVSAKDYGSPPLYSNVTVRICIIDENDNVPKILYPSPDMDGSVFEFIPYSAEKGHLVTKVIAVDADSGHNAWLSFHFLQVPEPSLFIIGQHSGEIRRGRHLPDKDSLKQKIVVLVKDNGIPSLSSTVTLNLVVAESFQQVVPEFKQQLTISNNSSNASFFLVIAIALISFTFIITVIVAIIFKCRKSNTPTTFGTYSRNVYPQFTLGCPSEISDTSLPFPFSYDVSVTLDSKQNEIAYLTPVQNVPIDNLIDTDDTAAISGSTIQTFPAIYMTEVC